MGDRTTVYIKFGGRISRAAAEALVEVLNDECYICSDGTDDKPEIGNLDEDFYADEVNYANIDAIHAVCVEHKIDYDMTHGAGGGYPAGNERYMGGRKEVCEGGDGPMIALSRLLEIETLATGLANVLDLARFMCGPFPDLVVDDTLPSLAEGESEEPETAA